MINQDRIVPIQVIDLISMYGLILNVGGEAVTAVDATDPGVFEVESASGNLIADEPVTSLDFASGVSSATVYFVPSFDYVGFTVDGSPVVPTGDVNADGRTLYKAVLSSGAVTITQVGF